MIEVSNISPVNKGSLLATCSVRIIPWKLSLHDVKVFEKGTNRWLGMPAKEKISSTGDKTYIELITFDTEASKNKFREQIMVAVDEYLKQNPEMKMPDVITLDAECPF